MGAAGPGSMVQLQLALRRLRAEAVLQRLGEVRDREGLVEEMRDAVRGELPHPGLVVELRGLASPHLPHRGAHVADPKRLEVGEPEDVAAGLRELAEAVLEFRGGADGQSVLSGPAIEEGGSGNLVLAGDRPVRLLGLSGVVVIDSPDGLLVMKRGASDLLRASVEKSLAEGRK